MPRDNILYPQELGNHEIVDYKFKKIQNTSNNIDQARPNETQTSKENIKEIEANQSASPMVSQQEIQEISNFNTNMMNKIEELSSKLQDVQNSFVNNNNEQASSDQINKSYQDGLNAGRAEALKDMDNQNQEDKERFSQSINQITEYTQKAQNTISSLESELVRASMDIAKEIIQTQIEANSQNVASGIAKNLLANLSEATSITLKVSVYDYDYIVSEIQDERIKIEKDLAIAKGGVMILSDVMNIDGTIKERFAKIKAAFYEEH